VRWTRLKDGTLFPAPYYICTHAGCLQVSDGIKGHFIEPDERAVIGNPLTYAIQRMKFLGR